MKKTLEKNTTKKKIRKLKEREECQKKKKHPKRR